MSNNTTRVSSCILNPTQTETNWQFQDETPDVVKAYFNAVGIMAWLPEVDFEQTLSQRFGFEATEYLAATKRETYTSKQAASLKAGNLELALAVRSQFDGTRYEEYFSWFTAANLPQPKRILDVGCDIGITTCFYATLYPQATITGIDSCREAIKCAQKLAAKLHLTNVEFIEADVLRLPAGLQGQKFDLVCSTLVADDRMYGPPYYAFSVEDLLAGQSSIAVDEGGVKYAQALAGLLADDHSKLLSFEETFTPHYLASWLDALREAGIYVPVETVEMLDFFDAEFGFEDSLPVMIGSKRAAELPTAEEIRSLWTGGIDESPEQDVYEDLMAESVLAATESKECRGSVLRKSPDWNAVGWNVVETELWATDSHVLLYKCSEDDRKLVRFPAENPGHVIDLLLEVLDDDREES